MHSCPNCRYEITDRYIGSRNNPSNFKCPKCKKKLEVTKASAIIYMAVTLIPVIIGVFLIKSTPIKAVAVLIWILLSLRIIRPKIYRYKLEDRKC